MKEVSRSVLERVYESEVVSRDWGRKDAFLSSTGGPLGTEVFERQMTGKMTNRGKEELLFILEVLASEWYFRNLCMWERPNYCPQILKPFRTLQSKHNC